MYDYKEKRLNAMKEFERIYQKNLSEFDEIIDLNIDLFSSICKNNPELVKNKLEFTFLMLRSVDYYISAIFLLKQRAFFESLCITRQSIETAVMTIHLNSNPDVYDKYKDSNYESTHSISYASKLISGFGKLWGNLSNIAVHPNSIQGLTQKSDELYSSCGSPFLNFGEKEYSPELDQYMLLTLKISGNIIYRCFEIITSSDSTESKSNEITNNELSFSGRNTAKILDELFDNYSYYRH